MASSIAAITIERSIDFSRATASAICSSSSLLALTAMTLVSFGRIEFATGQTLRGEAVFLCILRRRLLQRLRFRFVALGRIAALRMRRGRRRDSKTLLQLALGLLAASHRFR